MRRWCLGTARCDMLRLPPWSACVGWPAFQAKKSRSNNNLTKKSGLFRRSRLWWKDNEVPETTARKTGQREARGASPPGRDHVRLCPGPGRRIADAGDVVLLFDENHPGRLRDDLHAGLLAVHVTGVEACRHSPQSAGCWARSIATSGGPSAWRRF